MVEAKFYTVGFKQDFTPYESYEKAEEASKRLIARNKSSCYSGSEVIVFESVAKVNFPVPEAIVTKF